MANMGENDKHSQLYLGRREESTWRFDYEDFDISM